MKNIDTPRLGEGTRKGEYCVIENGVVTGKNCEIGHHAVIREGTVIGDNVRIDDFADIGKQPMRAKRSASAFPGKKCPAQIRDGAMIGTGAVIYAGCKIGADVFVGDLATVREDVEIGSGTIIGRGAAVENRCTIGSRCKIETNAYITALSTIGDDCFVAPCAVTSNDNFAARGKERFSAYRGVTMERGGRIGAGAVILPGRKIGEEGFAAAGSVVTKDVPRQTIVAGNPAKKLRDVPQDQLLQNE